MRVLRSGAISAALCMVWTLGCAPVPPADAGRTDAGRGDAGLLDAGVGDAGPRDTGLADGGTVDAGAPDAGPRDAGLADGGSVDAGDGGAGDAGLDALPTLDVLWPAHGALDADVTIAGTALDAEGPVVVRIEFESARHDVPVDADGTFTWQGRLSALPGHVRVTATDSADQQVTAERALAGPALVLHVRTESQAALHAPIHAALTIDGLVGRAASVAWRLDGAPLAAHHASADGALYALRTAGPHTLSVEVDTPDGGHATATAQVLGQTRGGPVREARGRVLDGWLRPLARAVVEAGGARTETDADGQFSLDVVGDAPVALQVTHGKHAPQVARVMPEAPIVVHMAPRGAGHILADAATGGTVDDPDGMHLEVPAGALRHADGTAAEGPVLVVLTRQSKSAPSALRVPTPALAQPGSFTGVQVVPGDTVLRPVENVHVAFWQRGTKLTLGEPATLTFSVPTGADPVPVWRMDDASGVWWPAVPGAQGTRSVRVHDGWYSSAAVVQPASGQQLMVPHPVTMEAPTRVRLAHAGVDRVFLVPPSETGQVRVAHDGTPESPAQYELSVASAGELYLARGTLTSPGEFVAPLLRAGPAVLPADAAWTDVAVRADVPTTLRIEAGAGVHTLELAAQADGAPLDGLLVRVYDHDGRVVLERHSTQLALPQWPLVARDAGPMWVELVPDLVGVTVRARLHASPDDVLQPGAPLTVDGLAGEGAVFAVDAHDDDIWAASAEGAVEVHTARGDGAPVHRALQSADGTHRVVRNRLLLPGLLRVRAAPGGPSTASVLARPVKSRGTVLTGERAAVVDGVIAQPGTLHHYTLWMPGTHRGLVELTAGPDAAHAGVYLAVNGLPIAQGPGARTVVFGTGGAAYTRTELWVGLADDATGPYTLRVGHAAPGPQHVVGTCPEATVSTLTLARFIGPEDTPAQITLCPGTHELYGAFQGNLAGMPGETQQTTVVDHGGGSTFALTGQAFSGLTLQTPRGGIALEGADCVLRDVVIAQDPAAAREAVFARCTGTTIEDVHVDGAAQALLLRGTGEAHVTGLQATQRAGATAGALLEVERYAGALSVQGSVLDAHAGPALAVRNDGAVTLADNALTQRTTAPALSLTAIQPGAVRLAVTGNTVAIADVALAPTAQGAVRYHIAGDGIELVTARNTITGDDVGDLAPVFQQFGAGGQTRTGLVASNVVRGFGAAWALTRVDQYTAIRVMHNSVAAVGGAAAFVCTAAGSVPPPALELWNNALESPGAAALVAHGALAIDGGGNAFSGAPGAAYTGTGAVNTAGDLVDAWLAWDPDTLMPGVGSVLVDAAQDPGIAWPDAVDGTPRATGSADIGAHER